MIIPLKWNKKNQLMRGADEECVVQNEKMQMIGVVLL